MHVYRWDLDKTYLQTDFDSVRGLLRAAREPAAAKRNVPGSGALLRALTRDEDARVVILSGSPTQLREVLSEKLRLDGVRFHELHLKDNLGNLRRGRLRAIRGQFGYKLPRLLRGRVGLDPAAGETLFGDDAEVDALVYSVFADALAGRIAPRQLERIMEAAGAYPDQIAEALGALEAIEPADAVGHVFIHLDRRMPPAHFRALGPRVVPVYSWFQAALVLWGTGQVDIGGLGDVARAVLEASDWDGVLANYFQDIVRRGHLHPSEAERMEAALLAGGGEPAVVEVLRACRQRAALLGERARYRPPAAPESADYIRLLKRFGRKQSQG